MTDAHAPTPPTPRDALASRSGDLGLEILGLRLNGAQLGAMLGVSRQSVSQAVKRGTIATPGPDGLFDARRAVREWMANSDPARVRARALKPGAEAIAELRTRVCELAADAARLRNELASEREQCELRVQAAAYKAADDAAERLGRFTDALQARWDEGTAARASGHLAEWLDEVTAVACYGLDLDEYRRERATDDATGETADCGHDGEASE